MSFAALLADLDALQKATPPVPPQKPRQPQNAPPNPNADAYRNAPPAASADALIQQAADGDADLDGTVDGEDLPELGDPSGSDGDGYHGDDYLVADADALEEQAEEEEEEEEEEGDEYLGKAFTMLTPNGKRVAAYDGTHMMKSFHQRLSTLETVMLKAAQQQTALIKSLRAEVAALKQQGRGRKTTLNIHEKPVGHFASAPQEPQALLAKALSAQKAGRLTGQDVGRIEAYLGRGLALPPELASLLA